MNAPMHTNRMFLDLPFKLVEAIPGNNRVIAVLVKNRVHCRLHRANNNNNKHDISSDLENNMNSFLKRAAVAAAFGLAMGTAQANCEVVTDPQFDSLPQLDLLSVEMFTSGSMIGATFTVTAYALPVVDGIYAVHWTDASGVGYYMGVWALVDALGLGLSVTGEYGSYDAGADTHSYVGNEGEATVTFNGTNDQITVLMPANFVGNPSGTLSNIGAIAGNATTLFGLDTTTNDGEWAVGSECSKADDANLADNLDSFDGEFYSSAGSMGWLMLLCGGMLLGLRRRVR